MTRPPPKPTVPVLTAPTASGKSALALRLAREFGLELVSADAFTVYRGLDIGTAKPSAQERAQVPHHLMDVADVREQYDVTRFRREAEAAIADILARGGRPLVVGGTGFYVAALTRGEPLTPASDPQGRAALEAELAGRGLDALLDEVAATLPAGRAEAQLRRLERNPRRVVRTLEVLRQTGRFPDEFGYAPPRFDCRVTAVSLDLPQLEARIAARTHALLEAGWPAEAAWLAEQVDPHALPRPTAWQALGYAEALAVARGSLSPGAAAQSITRQTRQYAKRQLTFIRRQLGAPLQTPQQAEAELRAFWTGDQSGAGQGAG